jgi:hypothetical protein
MRLLLAVDGHRWWLRRQSCEGELPADPRLIEQALLVVPDGASAGS